MQFDVAFFRGLIDVTASTFTDGTFAKWDDTAKRLVGASPITTGLANLEALASLGIIVQTATDTWAAREIVGVTDRTAVTFGTGVAGNPVVDIASTYAGQASITTLGTITTGTWQGTTLAVGYGGTGLTATPANGQLLIGNGAGYTLAGLTGTGNQVVVTPGAGSITLSLPQSIHTAATPTFASLTLSSAPTADNHAATKAYVDGVSQGLDFKASCRVATTAGITLSGAQTIDGVSVVAGDRVLVKNQSTASQNGLYVAASGAWSRAADADSSAEVTSGLYVFISEGTANGSSGWVLTTPDPITLGTTALTFTQFSGAGQITAGNGLNKSGNTLSAVAASGGGLTVSGSGIAIDTAWTGQAAITTLGTIATGTWQATAIAVGYGGTGLTATPANGQLLIGNGTGYTLTGLTGTGNQVVVTPGAGSITLSLPQSIHTAATPTFASLTLSNAPGAASAATRKDYVDGLTALDGTTIERVTSTIRVKDNGITVAKLAQIATSRLLGRTTAGTGNVEEVVLQAIGQALLSAATAAAGRTTLGFATGAELLNGVFEGRLSLTSSVPVTTSDVTSNVVRMVPYRGDRIRLYDGSNWIQTTFNSNNSVTLTGLTSGANYDVFAFFSGGALGCELGPAWTNGTTRSTDLAFQDGVRVKSGDPTRLYLGSFRTISSTSTANERNRRFLWNNYNRVAADLFDEETGASHSYTTGAWREWNNSTAYRLEYLLGLLEDAPVFHLHGRVNSSGDARLAFGFNSSASPTPTEGVFVINGNCGLSLSMSARRGVEAGLGYNYVTPMQLGAAGGDFNKVQITGSVLC